MSILGGPDIITDGLVLCLDAGNPRSYPSSGTTWNNLGTAGSTGSLINGPVFNSGSVGNISFDGVDDYVIHTAGSNGFGIAGAPANATLSGWLYLDTTTLSNFIFPFGFRTSSNGGATGPGFLFYFIILASLDTEARVGGTVNRIDVVVPFTNYAKKWTYVTVVANTTTTTTITLYLNGIAVGNSTGTIGNFETASGNFSIARDPYYGSTYTTNVKGNIGLVTLHNRPLTQAEVLQNYNATRSRFGA